MLRAQKLAHKGWPWRGDCTLRAKTRGGPEGVIALYVQKQGVAHKGPVTKFENFVSANKTLDVIATL